jgi:hypothetical protein
MTLANTSFGMNETGYRGYGGMRRQAQELASDFTSDFHITGAVRTTRVASELLTHQYRPAGARDPGRDDTSGISPQP